MNGDHDQPASTSARPSLKVDLTANAADSLTANDHLSPGSSQAGSATTPRSYSHSRSQSLSETREIRPPSPPILAPAGANSTSSTTANDLVRRHHTLSSSRLVRLERSKARLALSAEDQEYYNVPPSPIGGPAGLEGVRAAWSDLGHSVSSLGAGASGSKALGGGEWPVHSRATSHNSSIMPSASTWGTAVEPLLTPSSNMFPLMDSPGSISSFETSPQPSAKRSSFVVLRGAKGDAALAERRPVHQQHPPISPPRTGAVTNAGQAGTPPRPDLKHRNSLKPFLEADSDALGQQEEWEKSLQDERDKEEMELRREGRGLDAPYTTPPLSSSSMFQPRSYGSLGHSSQHARANTLSHPQQYSIASVTNSDAWINGTDEQSPLTGPGPRRHQSLNFRQDETSSTEDPWAISHDRSSASEDLFHGAAGFGRSRSGTRPPSLSLSQTPGGASTPLTSLSHSNSLSSHGSHSHHSHGGALSPVGGFPRSPWSPTVEETKQLGIGMAAVTPPPPPASFTTRALSRGGSSSSRESSGGHGARFSEDAVRLSDELSALDVTKDNDPTPQPVKPPQPPGLDIPAALSTNPDDAVTPRNLTRALTTGNGISPNRRLPPLLTNPDVLASLSSASNTPGMNAHSQSFVSRQGPASAAAFVPPIGHSHVSRDFRSVGGLESPSRGNFTAAPGGGGADWSLKKEMLVGGPPLTSTGTTAPPFPTAVGVNPLGESWPAGGGFGVGLAMQQQQQIQLLQSQMQQAMQVMDMMKAQGHAIPAGFPTLNTTTRNGMMNANSTTSQFAGHPGSSVTPPPPLQSNSSAPTADSPVDLPTLIANKGYNPTVFDLRPSNARFFVIKSYTEEDVHKSLKYEIWASTDLGNKRLDRAFRESADKGPIYLFFSVNGSGHFAGMAQMLTPVDYAMSSNVWASDKWKGVLKVRWIFIKDVPLANLRHIRLSNTPENKPVTSSRDTQEVPYAAGLEVLRILHSFQSRTSLLQDFHWYDARSSDSENAGPPPPPHYQQRSSTPGRESAQPPQPSQYQPPPFPPQQQFQVPPNYGPPSNGVAPSLPSVNGKRYFVAGNAGF